jgi:CspA family cold shock protein
MGQYKGTVKEFNNAKGYGFLGRDGGEDILVHISSIKEESYESIKEGEEVAFDIIQGERGLHADSVTRHAPAPQLPGIERLMARPPYGL